MISGIDHIAIAVPSLEEAIPFYRDHLGLELVATEEVAEQKVRVAMFAVGSSRIELLEPTADDSPISSFLKRRGAGLHHIALATNTLSDDLDKMAGSGLRLIDRQPKTGAEGKQIAFVHPKASGGVLLELSQDVD